VILRGGVDGVEVAPWKDGGEMAPDPHGRAAALDVVSSDGDDVVRAG
jgi:hypothetical protein